MQRKLITSQTDELRDTQTCGKSQMQQGPIAGTTVSAGIRRIEQRLHFRVRKIVDEWFIRSFNRDGFDATDLIEAAGQPIFQEAEEGFDGAESRISSLRKIMKMNHNVYKEHEDQRRI